MRTDPERVKHPAIEAALAEELELYKGQWVAVHENRVIAVSNSAVDVQSQARRQGVSDPLLFRVPTHSRRVAFL